MLTLDSFGAVALLKVGSKWLVQEKTPGYGVAAYVGRLALVGGAWDIGDSNPRHTVSREILEEVRPVSLAEELVNNLQWVGLYDVELTEIDVRVRLFGFIAKTEMDPLAHLLEGQMSLHDDLDKVISRLCWGHDHVAAAVLGSNSTHSQLLACEHIEPVSYDIYPIGVSRDDPRSGSPSFFDSDLAGCQTEKK